MQAKLRCAKYMYATTMVTKSGTTMVAPVAPLPTAQRTSHINIRLTELSTVSSLFEL